jgi:genome maintenance exonuclease 1
VGSKMHSNLENFILHETSPSGNFIAQMMTNLIINNGLSKVNEVWGTEVTLVASDLYAGSCDLVGVFDGKPAIMDFKNSRKEKRKEWIEDYFLQCAAYRLCHEEMFNNQIDSLVIMMATHTGKYLEFVAEGNEMQTYTSKWLRRLEEYYRRYG